MLSCKTQKKKQHWRKIEKAIEKKTISYFIETYEAVIFNYSIIHIVKGKWR